MNSDSLSRDLLLAEADDDDDDMEDLEVGGEDDDDELTIRIKSFRDVSVTVSKTGTVQDLKQAVVAALGKEAEDRYIRLVCRGRLLAPDSCTLDSLALDDHNNNVVHAVLAAVGQRAGPQALLQQSGSQISRRVFRGTGLNAAGLAVRNTQPTEDSSEDDDDDDGSERLGFDRLRNSGLRRSEVTAIRAYFSRQVERWIRQHAQEAQAAAGNETDLVRRRLLQEDAWMTAQGPTSEFRLNITGTSSLFPGTNTARLTQSPEAIMWRAGGMSANVGTDRDFLWGFMLGFFVGFLMLVWVWMPTVPHKQKLGILTGISFQLALSMLNGNQEDGDDVLGD